MSAEKQLQNKVFEYSPVAEVSVYAVSNPRCRDEDQTEQSATGRYKEAFGRPEGDAQGKRIVHASIAVPVKHVANPCHDWLDRDHCKDADHNVREKDDADSGTNV